MLRGNLFYLVPCVFFFKNFGDPGIVCDYEILFSVVHEWGIVTSDQPRLGLPSTSWTGDDNAAKIYVNWSWNNVVEQILAIILICPLLFGVLTKPEIVGERSCSKTCIPLCIPFLIFDQVIFLFNKRHIISIVSVLVISKHTTFFTFSAVEDIT